MMSAQGESTLSFSSINKLSAAKLKDLCMQHSIGLQHGKTAKVNFLCHKLGISTCGGASSTFFPRESNSGLNYKQQQEFSLLTPGVVDSLHGWEKTLNSCPEIEDATVKRYLLDADIIPKTASRTYQLSRPYQLQPMVHSINFHPLSESEHFCLVRAKCNPSQATSEAEVKSLYCILDKITGIPYGGYCTCTAGYCQACGHMGALLFVLVRLIASGAGSLPGDATVTDMPCEWAKPKGAAVGPKTLHDIRIRKDETPIRRTAEDYGKRFMGTRPPPTAAQLLKFRSDLLHAASKLGKEIPAVHALHPSRFQHSELPDESVHISYALPDVAMELDPSIAASVHMEVSSSAPPPIIFHPLLLDATQNIKDQFVRKKLTSELVFTPQQRLLIEEETQGQSSNLAWYQQRRGCITSSNAHAIIKVMQGESNADVGRLVRQSRGDCYANITRLPRPKQPSLKWGLANEDRARATYIQLQVALDHTDLHVSVPGIWVSPEAAYLRASPDGIVQCACHPPKLLEIKCPYGARELTVGDAILQKKIKYVAAEKDGSHTLLKTSEGYYTQIQMTMAIKGLKMCDFFVWTPKSFIVIQVPYDASFWNSAQALLKCFFQDHILPTIRRGVDHHSNSDDECLTEMMSLEKQTDSYAERQTLIQGTTHLVQPLPVVPRARVKAGQPMISTTCMHSKIALAEHDYAKVYHAHERNRLMPLDELADHDYANVDHECEQSMLVSLGNNPNNNPQH